MNNRRVAIAAVPAAAALLLASASPALAQTSGSTASSSTPSSTSSSTSQNPVAADAGSAVFVLRALPGATLPGLSSGNAAVKAALGLTEVTADSTRAQGQMSTAVSTPLGLAVGDTDTGAENPAQLSQSAAPDNTTAKTGGFDFPGQLSPIVSGGLLQGSVQARWSDTLGPCVSPISTATTSVASLSAVKTLPSLSGASGTTSALSGLTSLLGSATNSGLGSLAGLLGGTGSGAPVLTLPSTSSTTSTVQLVDVAGQTGKGVQATTKVQLSDLSLLQGSPLATTIQVVSQPTLTATSTGTASTSTVTYSSPVLKVTSPNGTVTQLDAQHPKLDITLTALLPATLPSDATTGLTSLLGSVLGSVPAAGSALPTSVDLGVLRLQVGQFAKVQNGTSVGGTASLLSLAVLPSTQLAKALGTTTNPLPSSLVQIGVGEQAARAAVGAGGVDCSLPPQVLGTVLTRSAPSTPSAAPLAYTSGAYATIPILWTAAGLLIAGAVMVAAVPGLPRRRTVRA